MTTPCEPGISPTILNPAEPNSSHLIPSHPILAHLICSLSTYPMSLSCEHVCRPPPSLPPSLQSQIDGPFPFPHNPPFPPPLSLYQRDCKSKGLVWKVIMDVKGMCWIRVAYTLLKHEGYSKSVRTRGDGIQPTPKQCSIMCSSVCH
jgi:hypothetical protein